VLETEQELKHFLRIGHLISHWWFNLGSEEPQLLRWDLVTWVCTEKEGQKPCEGCSMYLNWLSLFSVRAAVSAGMNISFCPATSGSAQVLIKRRGQLILTASEQDSLSTLICQVASLALLAQN
jgi:hypothetical protein